MTRLLLRLLGLGLLYVLASPVLFVIGIRRLSKLARLNDALSAGWVNCQSCGHRNSLNVLARCRRCSFAEYGSRLRCSACGQTTHYFDCARCGASVRVW